MLGVVLGFGAPLGLLALRRATNDGRGRSLRQEIRDQSITYSYVTLATCAAFALFGLLLGRRDDRIVEEHRQLDRLRDEFASLVAHDLRGPVQVLRMQAEILLRGASQEPVPVPSRALVRLHDATLELSRMIDDLLDANRVDARRIELDLEPVALAEVAAKLVEHDRPLLGSHPVTLQVDAEPPKVAVDLRRINQVLTNLLENAAKYSDPGAAIRVHVRPERGGASIAVEDHGRGIAPDDLPHLFERFYRGANVRAKRSGLGLGLYIVKGLVEAHRGTVRVESTQGRGSTFTVWLPAAPSA